MEYQKEKEDLQELVKMNVDDMLNVLCFIGWQDDSAVWGGKTRFEAFMSACKIMQIDPVIAMKIVRGD